MELMSKLRKGEMSVRIVPGPNDIIAGKYIGESSQIHKNVICNEKCRAPLGDVSFSSYLVGSNAEAISSTPWIGNAGDNHTNEEAIASIEGGDTAFVEGGVEKQNSCRERAPVLGRATEDCEISIFEAEKYFSASDEKKLDATHESKIKSSKTIRENSNSKAEIQASKNKVLLSTPESYDCRNPISSPASSIVAVNRSFRPPRGTTPTASSEASWNSQSGLLSRVACNSVYKSPTNDGRKSSGKWAFGCKWPCSNKKSVEIDNTLTEFKLARSVSNSLSSTALMNSPLTTVGERVLGRSIENQRSEGFADTASEISGIHSNTNGGSAIKSAINIPLAISVNRKPQNKLHKNSAKYDTDSNREDLGERLDHRRIKTKMFEKDGFSFPILSEKCEETPRPSLEVFGSPFPGTPDREETRNPTSGMHNPHQRQPLDLHCGRYSLCSNSETHELEGNINTSPKVKDGDADKESDSSSDLFEIESFTTQGTASCHPLRRRRDSNDDASSIRSTTCEPGFHQYYNFGGMEAALPLSAHSFCYEPSEASLDWSVATGDTIDKPHLGNLLQIMKR